MLIDVGTGMGFDSWDQVLISGVGDPHWFPHPMFTFMSSLKPALQDDDLRKALKQFQWDNDGSGPYYDGAGGNEEEEWVEVKEEDEQEGEWDWNQWEPEPASEPSGVDPLPPPPPPPPPTPPREEPNPKSQSWDYNTEEYGQGSWKWGGKWKSGHGSWNQDWGGRVMTNGPRNPRKLRGPTEREHQRGTM